MESKTMKTLPTADIDTSAEQELKLRRNLQVAFDEMIRCPTDGMGTYEICCMHYERAKRALDNLLLSRSALPAEIRRHVMNDTDTDTIVMTVHYNVTRTMSLTRTIHSSSMTWEKTDLQFHVDASTLCLLPGIPIPQNLEVVSAKTCARAMFVLSSETQHLGDVVRWNYKPVDGDVNAQKTLGVVIWNT